VKAFVVRVIPCAGDHPEDAQASSTLISRAFIPPCIPLFATLLYRDEPGLPLSDQTPAEAGRNPRRTFVFTEARAVPTLRALPAWMRIHR